MCVIRDTVILLLPGKKNRSFSFSCPQTQAEAAGCQDRHFILPPARSLWQRDCPPPPQSAARPRQAPYVHIHLQIQEDAMPSPASNKQGGQYGSMMPLQNRSKIS